MSKIVDVILEPRMVKGKAQAFTQGEFDEDDQEIWIWLPLSQIEVTPVDGREDIVEVSMPSWLAMNKELI